MPSKPKARLCTHKNLIFTSSSNAQIVGYKQPTASQRKADSTFPVIIPKARLDSTLSRNQGQGQDEVSSSTFPAPLVLPGDELSWDPTYLVQPLRSWYNANYRNKVTAKRKTIYLVRPPGIGAELEGVKGWAEPKVKAKGKSGEDGRVKWTGKETGDVLGYLGAFYHGMEVRMLDVEGGLNFTADVEEEGEQEPQKMKGKVGGKRHTKERKSPTIWLNTHTSKGLIGIRTRATPKGAFSHQLNLSDLLEAAMEILPEDAYALLMLVEHDMFEDEEDDFACGRAYGGSRVAVVSVARYDPILDVEQRVERGHG
jgi:archaemetzincin